MSNKQKINMNVRKIYFDHDDDIEVVLNRIAQNLPKQYPELFKTAVLYTLHKSGLIEDGIDKLQLEAAFQAYLEVSDIIADKLKHIAPKQ